MGRSAATQDRLTAAATSPVTAVFRFRVYILLYNIFSWGDVLSACIFRKGEENVHKTGDAFSDVFSINGNVPEKH